MRKCGTEYTSRTRGKRYRESQKQNLAPALVIFDAHGPPISAYQIKVSIAARENSHTHINSLEALSLPLLHTLTLSLFVSWPIYIFLYRFISYTDI